MNELSGRAPSGLRGFAVERGHDQTGVSGTGIVLEGVLLSTGMVVVHWLTPAPRGSVNVFETWQLFLETHILPHPENETVIYWWDGEVWPAQFFERYPPRPWPAPPGAELPPDEPESESEPAKAVRSLVEALEESLAKAKAGRAAPAKGPEAGA